MLEEVYFVFMESEMCLSAVIYSVQIHQKKSSDPFDQSSRQML